MTIQTLHKVNDSEVDVPFSLAVYCGSRAGLNDNYLDIARLVGQWIGQQGGQLVYGGGKSGMMGALATATQQAGGRVVGVIPHALVNREHANLACDEIYVVDTMHERKALMAERADCFLALPGGIGTFEELFEIWTWRQLGYHDKPVGILNVHGYYDAMLSFLKHCVSHGLMDSAQMELVSISTEPLELLQQLIAERDLAKSTANVKAA